MCWNDIHIFLQLIGCQIYSLHNKIALSADDDKRVIMEDGTHTLAYGHHKTPKPED